MADCLTRLGAGRVEASLVASLLVQSPLATKDIVARTGLRQPEVSVGMRTLRERGWVAAEPIPREGKGRPMHRYRLEVDAAQVYGHYAVQAQHQVDALKEALGQFAQSLPSGAALPDAVGMRHEGSVAEA